MKTFFTLTFSICVAISLSAQKSYSLPATITANDYIAKTIILKVKPVYASICTNNKIEHALFNTMATTIGVNNLQKKFPLDKSPEKETNNAGQKYADLSLIYELNYSSNYYIEKAISKLLASGILIYAEPHFIPKTTYNPNDPLATPANQYHLQTVNAFNGWTVNKGDSSIVIGITDTGTDPTHSDLFNNIKRNYNDVIDGVDNDGDNYIDNYMGWDLGAGDNDPTYQGSAHGVHVCGIASASTDNANGGAGLGFNCKFLPIKIADANGNLIAAYEGIKYAADHGCTSINCSWGGGGASQFGQDIITYASINKNCLVVCAAGNNGADGDFFPAAYNYVLAVANTTAGDTKHSSSNYGYFVDVCAPGDAINSTWPGNSYTQLTGTSMASPVVAGAAGIVKNQFPSYNGLQIGERLKVTADDIYSLNSSYLTKLGTGRINLYRALTDPASPSVVFTDIKTIDHNDNVFITGDTLFITGLFTNYLDPTTALTISVTPLSGLATVVDNTTTLGVINTLATATNTLDPFRFKLTGIIPTNQSMSFEVLMQDGAYQAKQYFTIFLNVDYINIVVNDVNTTATSRGKIGYNQDAQVQGLGFRYKTTDLLYEAGLMIGTDTNTVSDCVRGTNGTTADTDFSSVIKIVNQVPALTSDFDTKATFNDNTSISPISVEVLQNTYAWATAPNEQFVIWEYLIKNTSATNTVTNFYGGVFADWDIDGGTFSQNRSAYNTTTKMGYCYYTGASGKYAGIKLLTNTAPPNFYAIDNISGGSGGFDLTNGFDTKEKYKTLSTPRLAAGAIGVGTDNINVMSSGPYTILPNQTIKIAYALLGGDSLQSLIVGANQAQIKYDGLITTSNNIGLMLDYSIAIYPNPSTAVFHITQSTNQFKTVEVYSINGSLIRKHALTSLTETVDLSGYSKGMYVLKLIGDQKSLFKKIVLID
jgi:subtilisin family serine protease